jgi:hypothetical protein
MFDSSSCSWRGRDARPRREGGSSPGVQWAREYRDATSETLKQQLLAGTTEWDRLVEALYFPLLLALLLAVGLTALWLWREGPLTVG